MAGLISGPLPDDIAGQAVGPETTTSEAMGATIQGAWNSLPMVRQSALESDRALAGTAPTASYSGGIGNIPYDPETENLPHQAPVTISAEDANKDLPEGMTPFTAPVNPDVRAAMIARHQAAARAADTVNRSATTILNNPVTRFGVGALVSLADPLNDMAMMIPVAPEAFVAARLAAAGGLVERAAIRTGLGAAQGATGMAALQPLQYVQDIQDHEAFSIGEALRQIAFGAVAGAAGGAIHAGFAERAARLEPEAQMGALRASLADVMNDRPVDVAPMIDHADATATADRLEGWHQQQEKILADANAARDASRVETPDNAAAIAQHENNLGQLREQAAQLRGEHESLQQKAVVAGMDPETSTRLDEVQQELNGVISKARRAALEQERTMLLEGRGAIDTSTADLEGARTQSQIAGTQAVMARTAQAITVAETKLADLRTVDAQAQAEAQANRMSADRSLRISQARTDSREAVLQAMMEREVRQYAGKVGTALEPGEAARIASEIRTAQPAEVQDTIASHLNALAGRSKRADIQAATASRPVAPTTGTLRAEAQGAAREMAERRMNPTPDPEVVRAEKATAASIERAPKFEGEPARDLAEVEKMVADRKADYDAEVASGRMREHPTVETAGEGIEEEAKAGADYARCLVARGI